MNSLATIDHEAAGKQLRYLIIGGLAVNHYGYSRDTSDLDLFVSQNERAEWMQLLGKHGYANLHAGGNFIQYQAPDKNAWPVDLMLVPETTFVPILEAGHAAEFFWRKGQSSSAGTFDCVKAARVEKHAVASVLQRFFGCGNFDSHPPRIELQTMPKRIEENMPWPNSRPDEGARRLAEKIPVEFVL